MLSQVSASDKLRVGNSAGFPGEAQVPAGLYATHEEPLHAFSAAILFDNEALNFQGLDLDSQGIISGSVGYEYSHAQCDTEKGSIVLGVLLDFEEPYDFQVIPASPEEEQLLAEMLFNVRTDASPGTYEVEPKDGTGPTGSKNVFTINQGETVRPELQSGEFTVLNPYHLYVEGGRATPGGTASVRIVSDHPDPIGGYQLVIRYPSDVITLDTGPLDDPADDSDFVEEDVCAWPITWCGLGLQPLLANGNIEYFFAWARPDYAYAAEVPGEGSGRAYVVSVFDYLPPFEPAPVTLPAGQHTLIQIEFELSEELQPGTEIPLTLVNGTGQPPLNNMHDVPVDDEVDVSVHPKLHGGTIAVVKGQFFKRGRINGDSEINLGDVVFMLNYMFVGGAEPACLKGVDVNDDGMLNVADAIYLLEYLFGDGPEPPPPFESCGLDPTEDELSCNKAPGC